MTPQSQRPLQHHVPAHSFPWNTPYVDVWCNNCNSKPTGLDRPQDFRLPQYVSTQNSCESNPLDKVLHSTYPASQQGHYPIDPYSSNTRPFTCMWGTCNAFFSSQSDLIGHVDLQHLVSPSSPVVDNSSVAHNGQFDQMKQPTTLSCLWADCSSPGMPSFNDLDLLTYHLLHEHLGVPPSPPASLSPPVSNRIVQSPSPTDVTFDTIVRDTASASPLSDMHTHPQAQTPTPQSSSPLLQDVPHSCTGSYECRWRDCRLLFSSCSDLTAHITVAHIGSGKAKYECFWDLCTRNGSNGFQSKQKICRHVQVSLIFYFKAVDT